MSLPKPFVALLLVWLCVCALKLTAASPDVWKNDASGYYAWAQSLVVDGDLDPTNQLAAEDLPRVEVGDRRVAINKYAAGWSMAALPGMALGQAGCALANRAFGADYALDGLDPPVVRLSWLCVFAWTLLGLRASFSFVRSFTDSRSAAWGCGAAWLGTAAFAYTWKEPMMAHALCLSFVALSYELCRRWAARPDVRTALLAGAAVGMVLAVRPVNVLLLAPLLPILGASSTLPRSRHVVVALAGFAVPVAAQVLVWRLVYGVWYFNGYALRGEGFAFAPENVARVASSSRRGLLFWHPAALVALLGLASLARRRGRPNRAVAALGLASIIGLIVLYGSWSTWGLGWSHGARWTTDAYPLWALGFAAWLSARRSPGRAYCASRAVLALACVWSAALISLQLIGRLPMHGPIEVLGWTLP